MPFLFILFFFFWPCSVVVLELSCYHSRKPFKQTVAIVLPFLVHIITFIPRHCYLCKQVSVQQETISTTAVRGITSITSQWNSIEVKYTTFSFGVVFWRQDCPISGFRRSVVAVLEACLWCWMQPVVRALLPHTPSHLTSGGSYCRRKTPSVFLILQLGVENKPHFVYHYRWISNSPLTSMGFFFKEYTPNTLRHSVLTNLNVKVPVSVFALVKTPSKHINIGPQRKTRSGNCIVVQRQVPCVTIRGFCWKR